MLVQFRGRTITACYDVRQDAKVLLEVLQLLCPLQSGTLTMVNSETNKVVKPEESFQAQGITTESVIYLYVLFQSWVQYGDQRVRISYYEGDSVSSVLRDTLQFFHIEASPKKYQLYDSNLHLIKANATVEQSGLDSHLYLKEITRDILLTIHFNSDIEIATKSTSTIKQVKKSVLQKFFRNLYCSEYDDGFIILKESDPTFSLQESKTVDYYNLTSSSRLLLQPSGIPVVLSNSEKLLGNSLQPNLSFQKELQRRRNEVKEWKQKQIQEMEETMQRKQKERIFVNLELPSKNCLKIACSTDELIMDILKRGVAFLLHCSPSSDDLRKYYVRLEGSSQDLLLSEKPLWQYNINSNSKLLLCKRYD
ncbi:hypothetical protein WA171_003347 [Blastocystis sp. BT1]